MVTHLKPRCNTKRVTLAALLVLTSCLTAQASSFATNVAIHGASHLVFGATSQQPEKDQQADTKPESPQSVPEIIPWPLSDLSEAVSQLLEADYLNDAERSQLRIRHGAWLESDLTNPALAAAAAVVRGEYSHPSLSDPLANVEDRAEALIRTGKSAQAADLLKDAKSFRASRLRGEALLDLGKTDLAVADFKDAITRALRAVDSIESGKQPAASSDTALTGDELAEALRCALLLSRWQAPDAPEAVSHKTMLALLATARQDLDRLSWKARMVEALLLYEKDKYSEVSKAVAETLELNPKCAEAYFLYGLMTVDTFDFPRGERLAATLDQLAAPAPSIHAATIRAYIRLRQNEGEMAFEQLKPALAAFPDAPMLLAYHAASAAVRFDFAQADQLLADFDVKFPNSPYASFVVGKSMSGSRQYEEAARYLAIAAKRAPHWAEPVVELGLSEFQAGRNDAALSALLSATTLDPQNNRAVNSLTLLQELSTYVNIESEHFIVRCKPGVDEVVAREMLEPLEEIFTRVTGDGRGGIAHKPQHKTVVELYPNHRWFGVRITGMPQLHTIAAATGPVIAMEAPREGPGHMGAFDWRRVVQHEYTHTVTLSRTKNRLPHWFTEASAVYLEDAPRDYSTIRLLTMAYETDRVFDLDTINIMFVRPKRATDRSQAYAQGHMMYEYIIERFGDKKPLELMDLYAKGVREQAAFEQTLGVGREAFMEGFKVWMGEKLTGWGMIPTPAHPSIKQLLALDMDQKKEAVELKPQQDVPVQDAEVLQPEKIMLGEPNQDELGEPTGEQLAAWRKAYPGNPFVLELLIKMNQSVSMSNPTDEFLALLAEYAAARPMDPMPHKMLATHYLNSGQGDKAIEHLEYLDIREQSSPGYAVELSRQYAAKGDMQRAMAKASRATQVAPYDATYREYAATLALRAKSYEAAERHLKALAALEPSRPEHQKRLEALSRLRATVPAQGDK